MAVGSDRVGGGGTVGSEVIGFLIVTASEELRSRIEQMLDAFPSPCRVAPVENFAQAEGAIASGGISIAVVDEGCTVAEQLAAFREQRPGVPVILISALPSSSAAAEAESPGDAQVRLFPDQLDEGQFFRAVGWVLEHRNLIAERVAEAEFAGAKGESSVLEEAVWQLDRHDRERVDFIVNTSHELRTPLTSMLYGLSNLLKGVAGPIGERPRAYLDMFKAECLRMMTTVETILDVQRAGAGTLEPSKVTLVVGRLLERCLAALRDEALEREVTFDVSVTPAFLACDPRMMQRAITNVLRNAVQFSPFGGAVRIEATELSNQQLQITIADEGDGIEPQYLGRVMEPYFQVDGQISGTGLGLSITKEILDRHDGTIAMVSPPPGKSRGTEVVLQLPVAAPPRVLVVDDSVTIRRTLELTLSKEGYRVTTAENGKSALELIDEALPDLLIVDSIMPEMNGQELILEMKSQPERRTLPIIMITGAEVDREKRDFLEGFGIPTMGKPWDRLELLACIDDAIVGKGYLQR
jgi:signal transduction histidine kinase